MARDTRPAVTKAIQPRNFESTGLDDSM